MLASAADCVKREREALRASRQSICGQEEEEGIRGFGRRYPCMRWLVLVRWGHRCMSEAL